MNYKRKLDILFHYLCSKLWISLLFMFFINNICKATNIDTANIAGYSLNFIDSLVNDYYKSTNKNINFRVAGVCIEKNTMLNLDVIIISDCPIYPRYCCPDFYFYFNNHGIIIFLYPPTFTIRDSLWIKDFINTFRCCLVFYDDWYDTYNPPIYEYYIKNNKVIDKKEGYIRNNKIWNHLLKVYPPFNKPEVFNRE